MSATYRCEKCGFTTQLTDESRGSRTRCPECGEPRLVSSRSTLSIIGLPNLIAVALSIALAVMLLNRPHFRGDLQSGMGPLLIVVAVIFCLANGIAAALEIARSGRSGSDIGLLLHFLVDGILTKKQITPQARNARNGLWVGILSLIAGLTCLSLFQD